MSTITSILRLQERVSGPIRTVISSLRSADTAFQRLHASSANAIDTGSLAQARGSLNGMRQAVDNVDAGFDGVAESVRRAADEQGRFNRQMQTGSDSANRLLGTVRGLVGAYVGLNAVKGFVAVSDTLTQTTARLNMLTGDMAETKALQDAIFASAQRSRGAYQDSADAVAKIGLLAGNAFSDTGELVRFTELINKQFTIAGTSTEGVKAAMLQLTQAMGSGVLRGEELNSVLEQAPNIVHTIAASLGVSVGTLRSMAADGEITAEVVKTAMLDSADAINKQFESMPLTWGQAWQSVSNMAIRAFEPALNQLNSLLSSDSGQAAFQGMINAAIFLGQILQSVVDGVQRASDFIVSHWDIIGPLLIGGAVAIGGAFLWAGAQAAIAWLAATWPLVLIAGAIGLVIYLLGQAGISAGEMAGAVGGAIAVACAIVANLFFGLVQLVFGLIEFLINKFIAFANFFANVFQDPVASVIHLFADMADNVLGVIEKIASALDFVFGSNLAATVSGWRGTLSIMADNAAQKYGNGKYEKAVERLDLNATLSGLGIDMQRFNYGDSFRAGYNKATDFAKGFSELADKVKIGQSDFQGTPLIGNVESIAKDTGKISDSMDFAEEDLKYLRDLAEQDVVNRFTTAEIRVDMGGIYNQVSSDADLDGIMDHFIGRIWEASEMAAEGVHT